MLRFANPNSVDLDQDPYPAKKYNENTRLYQDWLDGCLVFGNPNMVLSVFGMYRMASCSDHPKLLSINFLRIILFTCTRADFFGFATLSLCFIALLS